MVQPFDGCPLLDQINRGVAGDALAEGLTHFNATVNCVGEQSEFVAVHDGLYYARGSGELLRGDAPMPDAEKDGDPMSSAPPAVAR